MTKNVLLVVLLPLLVTVVGGLLVEYLKPAVVYTPRDTPEPSGHPTQTSSASIASPVRKLLMQKWYVTEAPTLFGDLEVEFTETGQVVRTYYSRLTPNAVTTYPYEVTEEGQLSSGPGIDLKLIKVTRDELVLSWNGTVAHYKRPWYWWEKTLAGLGLVVVIAIIIVLKSLSG